MIEQSYLANRQNFLAVAQRAGARLVEIPHRMDLSLKTDIAVLGADTATQVVVVVSGVHGVELPAGSLLQQLWIPEVQKILPQVPDTKFVFVHALNPYGAERGMRTDWDIHGQGNIDPARNFVDFKDAKNTENTANAGIEAALENADLSIFSSFSMWVKLLYSAFVVQGKTSFKKGFVRGQYTNSDIPYFGGKAPSLTRITWDKIIADLVLRPQVRKIWHFDCHTGDGPFGLLQLYINDREGTHVYQDACCLVDAERVQQTEKYFAHIAGDIIDYWSQCDVAGISITPMTLEFGTSRAVIEGIDVLHAILMRTILQNKFNDCSPKAGKIIQQMHDAFAPQSPEWKKAVENQSEDMWRRFADILVTT